MTTCLILFARQFWSLLSTTARAQHVNGHSSAADRNSDTALGSYSATKITYKSEGRRATERQMAYIKQTLPVVVFICSLNFRIYTTLVYGSHHHLYRTCLGRVVDLTRRKVSGTEAADWIADVDARGRDDGEQRQQEDGPLAAQLVAESVRAAQLGVLDVTKEEEQPLQHDD